MSVHVIKYLSRSDTRLKQVMRSVGVYSIKIHKDPFQSLVESIVFQQLAGSAANTIYGRFIKYYDNVSALPQQILSTPESIFKSSIGLSSKKIEYIKDLSARVIDGRVNLSILPKLTDEEIVAQLTQVKRNWKVDGRNVFDILPWKTRCLTRWGSGRKESHSEDIFP